MAFWNSTSWTGLGNELDIKRANDENQKEIAQMGGSSGAWHPGPPPGQLGGAASLGSTGNWSPGAGPGPGWTAAAQVSYQAQLANQTVSPLQTGLTNQSIYSGYSGVRTHLVSPGGGITLGTTAPGHQHDRYIPLPGGCSTGTKYICTYSEYSGWNIKIETPDPASQPILNHTSFSLSEIEEAQQTIKDLESLNG